MKFDFVGRKNYWFALSTFIIVAGIVALFVKGLSYGIEFKGGVLFDLKLKKSVSTGGVRKILSPLGLKDSIIQPAGERQILVRTVPLDKKKQDEVIKAIDKEFGIEEVRDIQSVSPAWGREITKAALTALILSVVGILIYVSLRFEFKMAVSAIIALIHDLLVVVGVYALFGREVTPATVAAVLTILGYSLYDTIVIFHRIMENSKNIGRRTYSKMVNDSINQVLMRSINTSLTSILPVASLLFFGGATLKDFAFALFVGLISGAYSSIFIASPVLSLLKETEPYYRNLKKKYGKMNAAQRG
jgi:preprotein translocase SecF subunit